MTTKQIKTKILESTKEAIGVSFDPEVFNRALNRFKRFYKGYNSDFTLQDAILESGKWDIEYYYREADKHYGVGKYNRNGRIAE
jgi:hypothetical protein